MSLEGFNALPPDEVERALLAVCAAPQWAARVAAGRPYPTVEALQSAAERALTDADLDAAMAGHPRIGDHRAAGAARHEQSGVGGAPPAVLAALVAGNRAYEERFGHVYLVCATGRDADELLVDLNRRLANDAVTERGVARDQLAAINRLRIGRLVGRRDRPRSTSRMS